MTTIGSANVNVHRDGHVRVAALGAVGRHFLQTGNVLKRNKRDPINGLLINFIAYCRLMSLTL